MASGLQLQASTGIGGFTLANSTSTILSWDVPDDHQLHRFLVMSAMDVLTAETGGLIQVTYTLPDGTIPERTLYAADLTEGDQVAETTTLLVVNPNSTVTISQASAKTAGLAVLWAEIWGL